jgi:hypothetical protein
MDDKKRRERNALGYVYDLCAFVVEDSERPDFVMRATPDGACFGVEVSDLYESGVEARLDRKPGYAVGLLTQDLPLQDKEDRDNLLVEDVVFTSPDGSIVRGKAVGRRHGLPFSSYRDALLLRVCEKNRKALAYRSDVRFLTLVIVDRSDRLYLAEPHDLHPAIFTEDMRRALIETPFSEIYLVTTINSGRRVYLPLRTMLLVSYVFMFPSALAEFASGAASQCSNESLIQLHNYLSRLGCETTIGGTRESPRLVFGCSTFHFVNGDLQVAHTPDRLAPHGTVDASCEGPWDDSDFDTFFADYKARTPFLRAIVREASDVDDS